MQFQAIKLEQRVEKSVPRHTKPPLVECHTCHNICPYLNRGCRILGNMARRKLLHHHICQTHKVLHVLLHDLQHGKAQLCHEPEGKERQHPISPPIFRSVSLSLFLFIHREGGREMVGDCVRGRRLRAKRLGLAGAVKNPSKNEFMRHPDSSYDVPSTSWDTTTVSKIGPTIAVGSAKAQGSKVKPASQVRAAQSNQSEG
jgi:hypothetical protein